MLEYFHRILMVAIPSSFAMFLSQANYLVNFIVARGVADITQLAALGLGHSIWAASVTAFLGINSALSTQISQSYGMGQ